MRLNPDIHVLEVLEGFPGSDDDELLVTAFEPSPQLRIFGKLYLTLGSPAQLESAVLRTDPAVQRFISGELIYDDGSERAKALKGNTLGRARGPKAVRGMYS